MAERQIGWHSPKSPTCGISAPAVVPDEGYSDQPYIVKTDDGAWLVVVTTGKGMEGGGGQHVITRRSTDQGKTWSEAADVEPADGPEASYAVLLKVPFGRIYVFYNHNTDNIRKVKADNPPYKDGFCVPCRQPRSLRLKYSDDHGRSWSAARYDIPMREFEIDRKNADGGKLKYFWNVGKAFTHSEAGYVPVHKVGGFGEGFFTSSEGRSCGVFLWRILEAADAQGCLWAMVIGFVVGLFRMLVDAPVTLGLAAYKDGYPEGSFLWIINNINFQYFSILITLISAVVMVGVSYLTREPDYGKIKNLSFGTTTDEHRSESAQSWDWRDVLASAAVLAVIIAGYLCFRG